MTMTNLCNILHTTASSSLQKSNSFLCFCRLYTHQPLFGYTFFHVTHYICAHRQDDLLKFKDGEELQLLISVWLLVSDWLV